MLFSKVIIIAFAHKKSINSIRFYVSVCGLIINFVNLFRQMPVNIHSIGCSDITTDITTIFLQQIDSSFCVCSCVNFMNYAVCGHILYIYRHTKLGQECWFGDQYSNLPIDIYRNTKGGAPKKQPGRNKKSKKALSKY